MKRTLLITTLTTGVLIAAGAVIAQPATAATTQDTPVTATVAAGDLSITAPTAGVDLGDALDPGATVTADLSGVEVTDARAGTAGWTASVASTDFAPAGAGTAIPASAVTYSASDAALSGTSTVANAAPSTAPLALTTAGVAVQTATGVVGNNTATWTGTIALTVPTDAIADTYSATLTHSVA